MQFQQMNWIWEVRKAKKERGKKEEKNKKGKKDMMMDKFTDKCLKHYGARIISEVLKTNTTLTKLDLKDYSKKRKKKMKNQRKEKQDEWDEQPTSLEF